MVRRVRDELDHRWSRRNLSEYVDDHLGPRPRRRLDAHAEICPECGRMRRTLIALVRELRALGWRPPARAVAPRMASRIREGSRTPPR
ncbi:MAG: zf-HC2 domain-containing protein [Actinomycetota bacterium]|nr:zf-HC2 domain-containing protein [Actinomycetota bacterium]